MENNNQQKVGAGILVVSILQIVFLAFGALGLLAAAALKDTINSQLAASGQNITITTNELIISFAIMVLLLIGVILILAKKSIGVYIYFACVIANIVYSIVLNGFKFTTIFGLILPILMAVFIAQKKELYGFGSKSENINI
ncbi:MAG: hypothetical protein Q8936_02340 [Bacillota bacterium]|nr:hypothetical protein [Bacillota bacterium]